MSKKGNEIRKKMDAIIDFYLGVDNCKPNHVMVYEKDWRILVQEKNNKFDGYYRGVEVRPYVQPKDLS